MYLTWVSIDKSAFSAKFKLKTQVFVTPTVYNIET